MDSISQAALGAAVAGLVAGKRCSPKILLAGAALGTLPDLDVFLDYGDPISNMIEHRGFSHSLFVLIPFATVLAILWKRFVAESWPLWQLWLLITAALVTHPILDSFTTYGTQLFWPLNTPPVAISSIFIIDPLYTIPLLIPVLAAFIWRSRAAKLCGIGLTMSTLYLGWSLVAMGMIQDRVEENLAGTHLEGQPVFVAPTPLNTVLWRIVVLDGDKYWEGLASLKDEDPNIDWMPMARGEWPFPVNPTRLVDFEYFTKGFVRYQQEGNVLTVTDLRLGMAMYQPFKFIVAEMGEDNIWQMVEPKQVDPGPVLPRQIPALWMRLLGWQSIDAMLCNEHDCFRD
ncbi:metal-dependent hydrolase [Enterovibrio nigricans]|uniref:Inner membrane protein n=1 Tax=Enterovibrio nigricans DSM 22720 TaxID=1121868 RepID=A0A1T4U661_9GAMM|nr:metal-dependent hydrolase [Enterovibrio nigricans]PKF51339.1 metal-dependent hydrolase [Enterovibrio nigricans]SKA48008.1 inner membrane protein [Enterovibrio nigricans DSM 22720]